MLGLTGEKEPAEGTKGQRSCGGNKLGVFGEQKKPEWLEWSGWGTGRDMAGGRPGLAQRGLGTVFQGR